MTSRVFVFGSNLAGIHGAGSAKEAHLKWGAQWGEGIGRTGMAYAIPTKDENLKVLPLGRIADHVQVFLDYAAQHKDLQFQVVAIGCGLAGFQPKEIAPLFKVVSENVTLPPEFLEANWREMNKTSANEKKKNWTCHAQNSLGHGVLQIQNKTEEEAKRIAEQYTDRHFPKGEFFLEERKSSE